MSPTTSVLDRIQSRSLLAGVAALAVCAWGAFSNPQQFYQSYLMSFLFWSGITLGCLAVLMLHHLVGGGWGVLIRRMLEAGTRTLPLIALLLVPILFAIPQLFPWARPEEVARDPLLQRKAAYLNVPFFLIRTAICFLIWAILTYFLNRWSTEQDRTGAHLPARRMSKLSGPGLVLYVLTVTFFSMDWVMSLEPDWFSTIYSALFIVGQVLATLALVIAMLGLLATRTSLAEVLSSRYLRDLGNLLLAFVVLWAYMSFSQFLIMWTGNLTDEIPWYLRRIRNGWEWVAGFLIVFHFAVPFLLLLFREVKHRIVALSTLAAVLLVVRLVSLYWMVEPAFRNAGPRFQWLDWVTPIGMGGLWMAFFVWQLKRHPLLPVHDPNLREVLQNAGAA